MERRKFKFLILKVYQGRTRERRGSVAHTLISKLRTWRQGGDPHIFSSLIDGHSEFISDAGRLNFCIELPGNPILSDGKLDNQKHAIIFYCEYLPLIDVTTKYFEESEMCWRSSKSLSFQTRARTDRRIIATSRILLWQLSALASTSSPRTLHLERSKRGSEEIALWTFRFPQCTLHDYSRGSKMKQLRQRGKGRGLAFGTILNF